MEKYLVASSGDTLDSKVSGRFGHLARKAHDGDGGHGTGTGMDMAFSDNK